MSYATIYDDGTRCQIQGEGDPNTINGGGPVTLASTCTYGIFLNDQDGRPSFTVWIWNNANPATPWINRP